MTWDRRVIARLARSAADDPRRGGPNDADADARSREALMPGDGVAPGMSDSPYTQPRHLNHTSGNTPLSTIIARP